MIQIKKTILTLVALLAVTTGAWAESKPIGLNVEYAVGDVITSTTDVYVYYGEHPTNLKQMAVKITSTGPLTISMIFDDSFGFNGDDAVYYLPDGDATGGSAGAIPCVGESTGDATVVHVASGSGTLTDPYVFGSGPSGTPVPLTRGTGDKINEWTFTMPGGNVTLEPEYYPQAALTAAPTAINDVPATTDGAIVKAGTVANIGSTETAQGTVMYYAVQSATAPTAPDYDATGWTDKVPTATDFAEGNVYVWYYIKGAEPASGTDRTDANTCSDSEITALGTTGYVTLAAPPTYAITLKEGTEDVGEWTISPAEATKGTTITATYSGTKRVKSVKAVKKAAAGIVNPVVGQVIGSDGNNYDANATLPDGVDKVAMIAYVSGSNGLALALTDEEGKMDWSTAQTTCAAHTPAITGGTWKLASLDEWNNMITAAGSQTVLRDGFSSVGGTNMQLDCYWSSSEVDSENAWLYYFGNGQGYSVDDYKDSGYYVRACLAF